MKTYRLLIMLCFLLITLTHLMAGTHFNGTRSDTLYPPTNLQASDGVSQVFVEWDKPVTPGGTTPPGLLGYYIYRNGMNVYYINTPDQLNMIDMELEPGYYIYKATAYYDLTPYGNPGQFAESCFSNSDTTHGGCACPNLHEPWDQASFAFNEWHFYPSQGNWAISVSSGNPLPTAVFGPTPPLFNFDHSLFSKPVWSESICAVYTVQFDIKMEASVQGDSSKLLFEIYYDSTWYTKAVFNNVNTNQWIHCVYDVGEAAGNFYRIRFRATGDSSSAIGSWMVDNIHADFSCFPPDTLQADLTETEVILTWPQPCRTADTIVYPNGFNIYRTDSTGNPPFYRLNEEIVTDTTYHDPIQAAMRNGEFRYFVETSYIECNSDPSDTVFVSIPVGIGEIDGRTVQVFPNPAADVLNILCEFNIESVEIWSASGGIVCRETDIGLHQFSVPTGGLSEGIYELKISSGKVQITKKIMIMR